MKSRWALLLILVASGVTLPFVLSACGDPKPAANAGQEAKKKDPAPEPTAPNKDVENPKKVEKEQSPAEEFRLPNDPGGKLVLRTLSPPEMLPREREKLKMKPAPRAIENPSLPLTPQVASLPRLGNPSPGRPLFPQTVAPEALFGHEESFGPLPHSITFPAMDRVKIMTPDVTVPVSLPRMAQPVLEKAVTADPTLDESKASILSAAMPARESQAPYQRFTLPDPFENHETGALAGTPIPEVLPDGTVRPPR